jgi:predicted permease
VAVVSHGFWQRRYGGAADAIGRSLMVNRVPFTIVGVTPPDFFGAEVGSAFDVAIPIGVEPLLHGKESALDRRSYWWLDVMARLKPGQTASAAEAALRGAQPQIREATLPTDWRPQDLKSYLEEAFTLVPAANGQSYLRRRYVRPLYTLLVVVGLVLLVACANIANLLLARATARRHELSVRRALGASRLRLARQLLVESLVLSGAGALIGLLFARWGSQLLVRQLSTSTNTVFLDLSLDWRVLAFTMAAAILTTLVFGTAPAFRATRVEPIEALKEHGRGPVGQRRLGPASTLVVAQVALSLVLVVAAGLFVRTFATLARLSLGFDRDRVLVASVITPRGDAAPPDRIGLAARLREAVMAVPGVAQAAASVVTPVSGSTWQFSVEVQGGPPLPERQRGTHVNLITPCRSSWSWLQVSPSASRTLSSAAPIVGRGERTAEHGGHPEDVEEAAARPDAVNELRLAALRQVEVV